MPATLSNLRKDLMAFDASRLRFGDMIAGASAILLLIFMTVFDWYGVDVPGFGNQGGNAWKAFGFIDILLFLCLAAVIACVVIRALGAQVNTPVPLSTIMLAAGALASLLILFRIVVLPGDVADAKDLVDQFNKVSPGQDASVGRSIGIFLGFLAALGMTAGGFLSARERGEAVPGVDGLGAGTGGGPLGGG